ncbi:hypothetical protein F5Y12DRAFT_718085 [Xylaria sp. FL1777]|nr:hypothetical protein F5Y12DRAFT_718085 [Xylaria sp. FL1777]
MATLEEQKDIINTRAENLEALDAKKEKLQRELANLELKYEDSAASVYRYEQLCARSGRRGASKKYEKKMYKDLKENKKACKEAKGKMKTMDKAIKKAERTLLDAVD